MLTSSTGIRDRASSMNRVSIPSYRPQAKMSCCDLVYRAALAWLNGTPLGVGTISRGSWPGSEGWPGGAISSSASPQTSGFMTMPGPPPNGVSSTVRCGS